MRLSKRLRKDPTMTARVVRGYEKALADLIERTKDDLRFALNVKAMEDAPAKLDVTNAGARARRILDEVLLKSLGGKARAHLLEVERMSDERVKQLLKSLGIEATTGALSADRTLHDLLMERNLGALKGLTDSMGNDIVRELTDGMAKGEGIQQLTKRIDGAVDVGIVRARMIARMETLYAFNASAKDRYRRNGIGTVEWVAAMTANTCDRCRALDGKRFKLGEEPDIPLHPNCRCTLIPIVEEAA